MEESYDILAELEVKEITLLEEENTINSEEASTDQTVKEAYPPTFTKKIVEKVIFLIKYLSTSALIFGVLLIGANYSAYFNLAYSMIYAQEMQQTKNSLIQSVAAANIEDEKEEQTEKEVDTFKQLKKSESTQTKQLSEHSLGRFALKTQKEDIKLDIEINPYENRIIIPKIGKNIPLIDIKQKTVSGVGELNDIFMKELENGVIRYPGSAAPGENGNSFIFGHSSNFPWMEGDYNDVFSLLDHVVFDDEIVVYYGQEKHTYKIRTKDVIRPGDVSVLKSNDKSDRSKLTLMTCWPIGTTLNRLVLTADLIEVETKK